MPTFDTLQLRPQLHVGLERLGYTEMTDIQALALPEALAGRDLVGHARTGSGKTAVFGLAILQQLDLSLREPQALVLAPTRELAEQIVGSLRALAVGLPGVRVITVTGGSPSRDQRSAIEAGAHVIVGTPGRLLQHLQLGRIDTTRVQTLVLDEADRMLDMGFEEEVGGVLLRVPEDRQTLLFSATWPAVMERLSAQVQRDPTMLGGQALVDAELLHQSALLCEWEDRDEALRSVLLAREPVRTLVFCETRAQCRDVARFLGQAGAAALALHGELSQSDRDEVLVRFRNGTALILVATNVAARGLDVEGVGLVVCYEVSPEPEVHVHRVGRTARFEAKGEAVSLVAGGGKEVRRLKAIEQTLGEEIPKVDWRATPSEGLAHWSTPWRTLVVLGGRRDKLRAGDLLGALTRGAGLEGDDVGTITLTDRRAWVAVRAEVAAQAVTGLNRARIKKKRFRVKLVG
ncbi:MAG: ATP-dependent RNA helicase DbpA [Deltaproteobacteria bacterium]|nr:ATP-dependent RNA helicase DbpA [Deltaproteobacteria bacterium]